MENKREVNPLRLAREEKGLTQDDVARNVNLKPAAISLIETGKRKPSLDIFVELAILYEKSPKSLLKDLGYDVSKIPDDQS